MKNLLWKDAKLAYIMLPLNILKLLEKRTNKRKKNKSYKLVVCNREAGKEKRNEVNLKEQS